VKFLDQIRYLARAKQDAVGRGLDAVGSRLTWRVQESQEQRAECRVPERQLALDCPPSGLAGKLVLLGPAVTLGPLALESGHRT
jgi:hypothetical protein